MITNDTEIHKKARLSSDQDRVYRFDQFLNFLIAQQPVQINPPPGITKRFLHEFDVSLPFFDSLRNSYAGFDDWYIKSAQGHREAWCAINGTELCAICIFKMKENVALTDQGEIVPGKILKLCTFKVGDSVRGRKLGERVLFSAFKYATAHEARWVYLHVFGEEHEKLTQLCTDYGFKFFGKYKNQEDVYLKSMIPPVGEVNESALEFAINYYPYFRDDPSIKKFIVPIQRYYHEDLFPDISDKARGLFRNIIGTYSSQSNTIKRRISATHR